MSLHVKQLLVELSKMDPPTIYVIDLDKINTRELGENPRTQFHK